MDNATSEAWELVPTQLPALASASAQRLPSTCQWLLESESLQRWMSTEKSCLWLHGAPGCGKTVAVAAVISHLLETQDSERLPLVAYHFFAGPRSQDMEEDTLVGVPYTNIAQLGAALNVDGRVIKEAQLAFKSLEHNPGTADLDERTLCSAALYLAANNAVKLLTFAQLASAATLSERDIEGAYDAMKGWNEQQHNTKSLLRSWISQLSPSQDHQSRVAAVSVDDDLALLKSLLSETTQTYLFVDGIDSSSDIEALLGALEKITSWQIAHLHVFVSGRNTSRINETMTSFLKSDEIVVMFTTRCPRGIDDAQSPHADDIRLYVRTALQDRPRLSRIKNDEKTYQKALDVLFGMSGGIFLWVEEQLKLLEDSCENGTDLESIDFFQHSARMEEMYTKLLASIQPADREIARNLICWLMYSNEDVPISIQVLSELFTIDMEGDNPSFNPSRRLHNPLECLRILGCLTTLQSQFHWTFATIIRVDLMHLSLNMFLISDRIKESRAKYFSLSDSEAHSIVAAMSLAYLEQFTSSESIERNRTPGSMLQMYAQKALWFHIRNAGSIPYDIPLLTRRWLESPSFRFTNQGRSKLQCMALAGLHDDLQKCIEDGQNPSEVFFEVLQACGDLRDWDAAMILLRSGKIDLYESWDDSRLIDDLIDTDEMPLIEAGLETVNHITEDLLKYGIRRSERIREVLITKWKQTKDDNTKAPLSVLELAMKWNYTPVLEGLIDCIDVPQLREAQSDEARSLRMMLNERGITHFPPEDPKLVAIAKAMKDGNEVDQAIAKEIPIPTDIITRAARDRKADVIRSAAAQGMAMNQPGEPNPLSLLIAPANPKTELLMDTLLELGVDVNAQDENGTPLRYMSTYHTNLVRKLLSQGADASAQRLIAHKDLARLAPNGSTWDRPNNRDFKDMASNMASTALETATIAGKEDIIKLLLDHGVDVNQRIEGGIFEYALQAAYAMHKDVVYDLLIERGADAACLENNERVENIRRIVDQELAELEVKREKIAKESKESMKRQKAETAVLLQKVEDEWRKGPLCWVPEQDMSAGHILGVGPRKKR